MCVYLLHFARPIGGEGFKSAQHYVGYADDVTARLAQHRNGNGAAITAYLNVIGVEFDVARIWEHAQRDDERRLKNGGHFRDLCPVCAGDGALTKRTYGYTQTKGV